METKEKGRLTTTSPITNEIVDFEGKGKYFFRQFQIVYHAFSEYPKTMMMVEVDTGIMRSNITRYVAKMKRDGIIRLIRKGICPITKMSNVGFYITDGDVDPTSYLCPMQEAGRVHTNPVCKSVTTPVVKSIPAPEVKSDQAHGKYSFNLFNIPIYD